MSAAFAATLASVPDLIRDARQAIAESRERTGEITLRGPAPRRVLLVEDDESMAAIARTVIEQTAPGVEVVAVGSVVEALRAMPAGLMAAVVDWALPDGDARRVLAAAQGWRVPTVVLTGALRADETCPAPVIRKGQPSTLQLLAAWVRDRDQAVAREAAR